MCNIHATQNLLGCKQVLTTPENTITYHNAPFHNARFQGKLKTLLMQNFGVTNKEHYGMLWYFLEWSIRIVAEVNK